MKKEPARRLEDKVALYRGEALELRSERVQDTGIERRAQSDVLRVQLEQRVEVALRRLREIVALDVLAEVGFRSARGISARLAAIACG